MNHTKRNRCRYCGSFECPKHDNCRDKGPIKMKQEEPCIPATCSNGKCRATNECIDTVHIESPPLMPSAPRAKRIYLAGPMQGLPAFNFPAFHAAAAKLRAEGHIVFNPAERDIERDGKDWSREVPSGNLADATAKGFNRRVALTDDLNWICTEADTIVLLPGWQKSSGARAEHSVAETLGLEIIELEPAENIGPLNALSRDCHAANQHWWHDPQTGEKLVRNKGEMLMLIVSEISEAMEGERKSLMDDKLPHRKMVEVEFADALIRIFDYAGAYGFDLDGAVAEKREYNKHRADHKPEARLAAGGKKW